MLSRLTRPTYQVDDNHGQTSLAVRFAADHSPGQNNQISSATPETTEWSHQTTRSGYACGGRSPELTTGRRPA